MEGHRRYAEEPEPRWYSGQTPYESGAHERPDGAYRLPGQRPGDPDPVAPSSGYPDRYPYTSPAAYPATDPLTSGDFGGNRTDGASTTGTARSALDAIRGPLPPTEYPAVRPGGAVAGDPAGPGGTSGTISTPASRWAAEPGTPAGPAHDDPTGFVPPVTSRSGNGPDTARSTAERVAGPRPGGERVYRTRRPALAVVVGVVTALLMVPVVRLLAQVTFSGPPTAAGIVPAVLLTLGLPLTGAGLYGVAGAGPAADRSALLRPPTCYLLVGLVLLIAAGLATS